MKPKRFYFRTTSIFGTPLKYGAPLFVGFTVLISGLDAQGGDILRGGSSASNKPASAAAGAPTPAASAAARANAKDTLARTTRSLDAARAMQNAARNAAIKNGANHLGKNPNNLAVTLPKVPNGLVTGGLKVAPTVPSDPTKWIGAKLPTQTVKNGKTKVTIKQTEQQALLNWETFNVGKKTTVTFDQTKGGADVGKWIAFNKITDPSGNPTQILGNIKAKGQVYLINTNGIIFGGSSQVNARGLTASSLPINDNLVNQGLLNNRDAQFLFSGLSVPGGADGTPDFNPEPPPAATGKFGDVTVRKGAILKSPADSGGSGGRIMLVGPNVTNEGTISTESGQTILAAGLQVGVAAHDGNDPSLRGLDVWVGDVGNYGGTAVNGGIIESLTGSIFIGGKKIDQLGILESSTSVSLNGRIDLKASYGAVANPNFDSSSGLGANGPRFFNQFTGVVTMGEGSVSRILPDYSSKVKVPGTELPERSQVNIEGLAIHFDKDSSLFAPNAEVSVLAGTWPYKDANGDRTIFGANGLPESGLDTNYSGAKQKFLFDKGQIYIDEASTINVAGSVDVFVPLAQSILTVELRGSELADSPLQRDSEVRGVPLTVDIRNTGIHNGKYWVGTPLGDVTGLVGLIERNAAQLTAVGGNITLRAGESIVARSKSSLDVSGGYYKHEAGVAKTSFLIKGGRLIAIEDATPDLKYDGVFTGESTFYSEKWGVSETFSTPLFNGTNAETFVEGAAGGTLSITAPSMALDGKLRGITVEGPRQRTTPAAGSTIKLSFEGEKARLSSTGATIGFINYSPTPPDVVFARKSGETSMPEFALVNDAPVALPQDRLDTVVLTEDLLGDNGFGSLEVFNPEGAITVPDKVRLTTAPKGSITLSGSNITVLGSVIAPGGKLSFTTYNIGPELAAQFVGASASGSAPFPVALADRGMFTLGPDATLSAAGLVADDREESASLVGEPIITGGGEISIKSYNADLLAGSVIDVSGGVFVSDKAVRSYGKGGTISIITGNDAGFSGLVGGILNLNSKLKAYSGATGGTLNLQAGLIRIGGTAGPGVLNLSADFFQQGGFTKYSLTGIGAKSATPPPAGQFESYIPAISIAAGTSIRPLAESLIAEDDPDRKGRLVIKRFTNEDGLRSPVSLGFTGLGLDDPFTIESLEVRADIVMEAGSKIRTEAGASVSFKSGTVTLLGAVMAPGGTISVAGSGSFPLTATQRLTVSHALPTVHLGDAARLSVAGVVQLKPDAFGRRVGNVHDGGSISLTGNILAEKGSQLDASGTSGILDLTPSSVSTPDVAPLASTGGLTSTPFALETVPTRVDSDGGSISLAGSQMLVTDATLKGKAGGTSALGGTLSISSGRFYMDGAARNSAETNLVIIQSGDVIRNPDAAMGIGSALTDATGAPYGDLGLFALNRFKGGGFSSLGLGGNIEFQGPVDLKVPGSLRLAAGGVIRGTDSVRISASYISVGQAFRAPENPDDVFFPFTQEPAAPNREYFFAPTFGSGILSLNAELIDVGTLSLQGIGKLDLTAKNGEIRGNGTLSVAGDVTLTASQIYPTSLNSFEIFAYDHDGKAGSVTIKPSGKSEGIPISAGGNLAIYSSIINQHGVLRAPLGTITLGWDGTDIDPGDSDLDTPYNNIAGAAVTAPVTGKVTLGNGSLTSVSASTEKGEPAWVAPFGISPDGQSWIDPRGVNVTLNGMPEKSVSIRGEDVAMDSDAVVDIRGGGELIASRWLQGPGGSMDLLGSASSSWVSGTEYQAGDLVSFGGATWSARIRHSGQAPVIGLYWSKIAESFAIIPTSGPAFSPFNAYNTGSNAGLLSGDPGFTSSDLSVGDTITLEGSKGVPAGTYTLLPRRYALLPGAYLVTEVTAGGVGTFKKADGARIVSGYLGNRFNETQSAPLERSRYEVASAKVIQSRVDYETYSATTFLGGIADKQDVANPQLLPGDAGYASFHGNSGLRLAGKMLTQSPGLGARVDVSSSADIVLTIFGTGKPAAGSVVLGASVLTSWGADSLVIGGLRHEDAGVTTLDVRTNNLTLDNAGGKLSADDVVLASNGLLELKGGSSLTAATDSKDSKYTADVMTVSGDGALLRVSADAAALTSRTDFTGATTALMKIGSASEIRGESVILDSTYGSNLAANLKLAADTLIFGSGQISVVMDGASGALIGSIVSPHLVLSGATLEDAFSSRDLTLRSYRSIDLYGSGDLGGGKLEKLTLSGSGVRGYGQAGGNVTLRAGEVVFENSINSASVGAPANSSGGFTVDAGRIRLGENAFAVNGYRALTMNASGGLVVQGEGSFNTGANVRVISPLISGEARTSYSIISSGAMVLESGDGKATSSGALGAGLTLQAASIRANSDILLPSGELTLRATTGNLEVGGKLSVAGTRKAFGKLIRYSDAGSITLESAGGNVVLSEGSVVSVAASSGGGNAGDLNVIVPAGTFAASGSLLGQAASNYRTGGFSLDAGILQNSSTGSLKGINSSLDGGDFTASREFRIRSGDVVIDHDIRSRIFSLAADQGSLVVSGKIDASGQTGGSISLAAHGDLIVSSGSGLSVAAARFDSAGKGGSILLEAGTQRDGVANTGALLSLDSGAKLDLSVSKYVAGNYNTPGSSAFEGKFTGTLHLRAPRTAANDDLRIGALQSSIIGASSIVAEGFKVYTPAGGVLNIAQRNLINADAISFLGSTGVGNANETAVRSRLLGGSTSSLDSILVLAPGAEIINPTGNLTLGLANNTSAGITSAEALASADWDLSGFRYGSKSAPGVLTLRAQGDLIFNNTLSDGFTPIAQGSAQVFADNGHSLMWLATLATIKDSLPANTQSWSYRLTAGADTNSSDFGGVLSAADLDRLQPGKGSVIVGEFYPAVPNSTTSGTAAGTGVNGQTADTIRISTTTVNRGNRFEVVRTGTGNISINAGRDVQLRNSFSTIYTAGVALPKPTTVYSDNDFVVPVIPANLNRHPSQSISGTLGAIQQIYQPVWSMAGGDVSLAAAANIGRYTLVNGVLTVDTSRQMPTNWLYRRGYVDPGTGLFADDGGFGDIPNVNNTTNITDSATSTTWWIDFSNFFQGIGTLGGGNIELSAGKDIVNVDAVAPTNARMAGRRKNPDFGIVADAPEYLNLAPDEANLLELGGGDMTVSAGRNIDGGIYYVERGSGVLDAGGEITTNSARSLNAGILNNSDPVDPLTWMPTTLFVGKSHFDVSARGDILLGPVTNPFLLPQGLNNKYWYKTYFNTFSKDAGVSVTSLGGDVTHRTEVSQAGGVSSVSILESWVSTQNQYTGVSSAFNSSNYQPWLRLAELNLSTFGTVFKLFAPNLRSTALGGDLHLTGDITLAPSSTGDLELAASGGIIGLNPTGEGSFNNSPVVTWTSANVNLSDAAPESIPGITNPLAYQVVAGRSQVAHFQGSADILSEVSRSLNETGSYTGESGTQRVKSALHDDGLLHSGDQRPVTIYAATGDITGLTVFLPKKARILAGRDITDVSLYLQNLTKKDVTLISAGRDVVPFNETSEVRSAADNLQTGNYVGDSPRATVTGTTSKAAAGDIRISGPGVLEVISGRNLDLGNGSNFIDGSGTGISSIGNLRNPFLPFAGANIITLAGVTGPKGVGAADGISKSSMNIEAFIDKYLADPDEFKSKYRKSLGGNKDFDDLTDEQQAIVGLEKFFSVLRDVGEEAATTGVYKPGYKAVRKLFGKVNIGGDIFTRSREIRTTSGGAISAGVPDGGITMASEISGNPLTPPGIVTEFGGSISTFTDQNVDLGQARVFTLRGGDIVMWSSNGNLAAGNSPRTVVTAPPTRVVFDISSASVQTDLGGLATGGGIGVLAAVEGVAPGKVALIAPRGFVDAGDAGIQSTGDLTIAAQAVLNAGNISSGGTSTGTSVAVAAAPSVSTVTAASNSSAAAGTTAAKPDEEKKPVETPDVEEALSVITVEVIGYGGASEEEEEDDKPAE